MSSHLLSVHSQPTRSRRPYPHDARLPSVLLLLPSAWSTTASPVRVKRRRFSCPRTGPRSPLLLPSARSATAPPSVHRGRSSKRGKTEELPGSRVCRPTPADFRFRAAGGETSQPRWIRPLAGSSLGVCLAPLESATDVALGVRCRRRLWSLLPSPPLEFTPPPRARVGVYPRQDPATLTSSDDGLQLALVCNMCIYSSPLIKGLFLYSCLPLILLTYVQFSMSQISCCWCLIDPWQ
jgi:hypothetical protein